MMRSVIALATCIAVLLGPAAQAAEEMSAIKQRGVDLNSVLSAGDLDSVNSFNGNLSVAIPLGSEYGFPSGLRYRFALIYNSTLWDTLSFSGFAFPDQNSPLPVTLSLPMGDSNAGLGWRISLGDLYPPTPLSQPSVQDLSENGMPVNETAFWAYSSPDGARHYFHSVPNPDSTNGLSDGVLYTSDSSYLRLRKVAPKKRELDFPDGSVHTFECLASPDVPEPNPASDDCWRLTLVQDSFARSGGAGNWVKLEHPTSYDGNLVVSDSLLRTHTVTYRALVTGNRYFNQVIERVDLAAPGDLDEPGLDRRVHYELQVSELPIVRGCTYGSFRAYKIGNRFIPQVLTVPMLAGLEVRDPQAGAGNSLLGAYHFEYHRLENPEDAPYDCAFINGRLDAMTQPTGKRTAWTYGPIPMPAAGCVTPTEDDGLPGDTPQPPRVEGVVEKNTWSAPDGESDPARWLFLREIAHDQQSDVPASCEFVPRQLSTSIQNPRGHVSVQYFSVHQDADYWDAGAKGWSVEEYGQPFSRYRSRGGISVDLPGAEPLTLFLGGEFYECPEGYDPRSPAQGDVVQGTAPTANPVDLVLAEHTPAAVGGCTLLRQTYVAYDSDTQHAPTFGGAPIGQPQCETVAPEPNFPTGPAPIECGATNRRLRESLTVYADDGARHKSTRYDDYDNLGNFRRITSDGNLATGPDRGGPIHSFTSFNSGTGQYHVPGPNSVWLLGLYTKRIRRQGGDVDRADYFFDAQTGFLQRKRELKSMSAALACDPSRPQVLSDPKPGEGDIGVEYTPVKVGDAVKNGEIESVAIFGGDDNALPTGGCAPADFATATPRMMQAVQYEHGQISRTATVDIEDPTSELLISSRATVDRNSGLALQAWDASGVSTVASYDVLGRTIRERTGSLPVTTYEYCMATSTTDGCAASNRIKVKTSNGANDVLAEGFHHFDGYGRLRVEEKDALIDGAPEQPSEATVRVKRKFRYDAGGLLVEQTPFAVAPPLFSNNYLFSHDALGRMLESTTPDQNVTKYVYQGDRVVTRKSRVARPDGEHPMIPVDLVYDDHGRLIEVHEDSRGVYSANVPEPVTYYKHDVNGNIRFINTKGSDGLGQESNQERMYDFDGLGRIRLEVLPELGQSADGSPASVRSHESYDALGNLLRTRTGQTLIVSKFDSIGRLVRSYEGEPVNERLLLERSYGLTNSNQEMRIGKVVSEKRHNYIPIDPAAPQSGEEHWVVREDYRYAGPNGSLDRTSLRATRSVDGVQSGGGVAFDTSATYLPTGDIDTLSYPQCSAMGCSAAAAPSRGITYRYALGSPTDVSVVAGSTTRRLASYAYHPDGMLKALRHYDTAGVVTATESWALDDSGMSRPTAISLTTYKANVVPPAVISWDTGPIQYDGSGNIHSVGTDTYGYDRARRLKRSTTGGKLQEINYDAFGNIVGFQFTGLDTGPLTRSFEVDSSTNRLTGAGYGYDDRGNMTAWHGRGLGYDAFDMPTYASWQEGASGVQQGYIYAPGDRRVAIVDYQANGMQLWTVRRTSGSVLREFTRVPGQEPAWRRDYITSATRTLTSFESTPTGERQRRYHVDHLGSTRAVTAANGAVVARYDYFPFGELALTSGAEVDDKRILFTGHERDRNASGGDDDLDYMMARYYAPAYGRFLNMDTLPGSADAPQSWNRFSYVLNNPLMSVDPTGNACARPGPGHSDIANPADCAAYGAPDGGNTFVEAKSGPRAGLKPNQRELGKHLNGGGEVEVVSGGNQDYPNGSRHRGTYEVDRHTLADVNATDPNAKTSGQKGQAGEQRSLENRLNKGQVNTASEIKLRTVGRQGGEVSSRVDLAFKRGAAVVEKGKDALSAVANVVPKGAAARLTDIGGKALKKILPGAGLVAAGVAVKNGQYEDAFFAAGGEVPVAGLAIDALGAINDVIKSDWFVDKLADRL